MKVPHKCFIHRSSGSGQIFILFVCHVWHHLVKMAQTYVEKKGISLPRFPLPLQAIVLPEHLQKKASEHGNEVAVRQGGWVYIGSISSNYKIFTWIKSPCWQWRNLFCLWMCSLDPNYCSNSNRGPDLDGRLHSSGLMVALTSMPFHLNLWKIES